MRGRRRRRDHADGQVDAVVAGDEFRLSGRVARAECTAAGGIDVDEPGRWTESSKRRGF
jgi:hypothetical protein